MRGWGTTSARRSAPFVALVLSSILVGAPLALADDPSQITAACSVSDGEGPFSPSAPISLVEGSQLVFNFRYTHGDAGAGAVYDVTFTATILTSEAFGLTHVLDTWTLSGGQGISTSTNRRVLVGPTPSNAIQGITVRITSDATGSTVLSRCDFILTPVELNDDFDGDGIENDVETAGLRDAQGALVLQGDGTPAGDFPSLGANPCRKDLFIEMDHQVGADGHDHQLDARAITMVVDSFDAAPIPAPDLACPFSGFTSEPGVHLVIEVDDALDEGDAHAIGCGDANTGTFDPARAPYFLYDFQAHAIAGGYTGLAPCPLNDGGRGFLVAVGGQAPYLLAAVPQAVTFMHELGHTLGLGHGGADPINLKPNYVSVMNYSFAGGIPNGGSVPRVDYSGAQLPTLDEAQLQEVVGIGGYGGYTRWWGPPPGYSYPGKSVSAVAAGPLDWNQNGQFDGGLVSVDVNSDGLCITAGPNGTIETTAAADDIRSGQEIRNGANHVCDSRPVADDVLGPSPTDLWCVTQGPNGVRDTTPAGDDVLNPQYGYVAVGPNLTCDTPASGDDLQFTAVGRGEPLLRGFDDWGAIDWRLGPSRAAPAPGAPLPPVEPHHDLTVAQLDAIVAAEQPHAPTVTGVPDRAPNANGWYAAPVTIDWQVSDDAGRASVPPDTVAATEGAGVTYTSAPSCVPTGECATGQLPLSIDLTDPTVTCQPASFALRQPGTAVTAIVSDAASGPVDATVSSPVSTAVVGSGSVTVTGADRAGRTRSVSCPYSVRYLFSGFATPVDGPPVLNKAIAGALPIPITWRLTDHFGVGIKDPRSFIGFTSASISCPSGARVDPLEFYGLLPGLLYLGNGYWTYGWLTPRSYRGSCREVRLNLADGVGTRLAQFRFT